MVDTVRGIKIKQAVQGLFTAGTSVIRPLKGLDTYDEVRDQRSDHKDRDRCLPRLKEKVGGKRGLKPPGMRVPDVQGCPNNPAGYKLYKP